METEKDANITLIVGGQEFITTLSTLRNEPDSMLASKFAPRWFDQETSGAQRIDRDPRHFRLILNYLRNGCRLATLPEDTVLHSELKLEAEYYDLAGLAAAIDVSASRLPGQEAIGSREEYAVISSCDNTLELQLQVKACLFACLDIHVY